MKANLLLMEFNVSLQRIKKELNTTNEIISLQEAMKKLHEQNDRINVLEEDKINLQIKLQKIRDYAAEDGEVKQGVIEKVVMMDD